MFRIYSQVKISIIIPTYNEADNISSIVSYFKASEGDCLAEIIVSDGGSTDDTIAIAKACGAITAISPVKGRAGQMNHAVSLATGDVYYFVHADCKPPKSYQQDILRAIEDGFDCGSFRTVFDCNSYMLKVNAFFTRFNYLFFRGGDQSIFVTKQLMNKVGMYKEDMLIMEDYDFLTRIQKQGKFKLIPKATLVSARKYDENTWLEVQRANYSVVKLYNKGATQEEMIATYKRMLKYRDSSFDKE